MFKCNNSFRDRLDYKLFLPKQIWGSDDAVEKSVRFKKDWSASSVFAAVNEKQRLAAAERLWAERCSGRGLAVSYKTKENVKRKQSGAPWSLVRFCM